MQEPKLHEIWMSTFGVVQVVHEHGGYTDCPLQVRKAGSNHWYAVDLDVFIYKIGG